MRSRTVVTGRRLPSRIVLLAVAILSSESPACVASGHSDLVIRSWGTEAGLPQNTINAIAQTRDGYLWLGTRDGLARFDGIRFTIFGLREGLQSVEVQTLFEDHQGTLWIGTGGGGLSRLVNGSIENLTIPQKGAADDVTALAEDNDGRLWIGTRSGLAIWQEGKFLKIDSLSTLNQKPIYSLLFDHHDTMWIATSTTGLYEYRDGSLFLSKGPPGNERIRAYCLLEDKNANLWASIGNGIVLCRRDGEWGSYTQNDGLPFAYVTSLAEGDDGTIWAGSLDAGLYGFRDGHFSVVNAENGLSADDIRSLFEDREGNLWVGTRTGGLNRLCRRKLIVCGAAQGLTNDFTRSVAESKDGTLWVGAIGGGLYRGNISGFTQFAPEPVVAFYPFVNSVLVTSDGSLWWGSGRAMFSWRDDKLTGVYTNDTWLHSGAVTALCEDLHGGVWIGTSESKLIHYENGGFTEFPHRIAHGAVTALAQQKDGRLWVGSVAGGLKCVSTNGEEVLSLDGSLLSEAIRTLHLDEDGSLWIGTAGGGLSHWRHRRIDTFTTRQGLETDTISQILEDDFGCLWLGGNHGIFRVRKSELEELAENRIRQLHPRVFGLNEGMPVEECSSGFSPAGLKLSTGLLCFPTVKGLVFIDPQKQESRSLPPVVLMEESILNGNIQSLAEEEAAAVAFTSSRSMPESEILPRLVVPPGARDVEIHYTAISFASPEKIRFRYRLEGRDKEWFEAGSQRAANYRGIPPGAYTFRVVACNADGVWSRDGTALALIVQPFLWEKPWFQGMTAVVTIGLIVAGFRLIERRNFKRRLARVELQHSIEKERMRISQDIHDHIGSILTQVSQISDLGHGSGRTSVEGKGYFERIGEHARGAVQALDEIVWATNPKNDNLPRFAEYLSRYADECFENSTVRCWQDIPADLPNLPLRANVRHNVFLAIREAFNNVIKHSHASEMWLRLSMDKSFVRLDLEDNGKGFTETKTRPGGGNGMQNMAARLAESGGKMEVSGKPGGGAKLVFHFPLSQEG